MKSRLRELRIQKGFPIQYRFAGEVGIHQSRISLIERGDRPTANERKKLAAFLQADPKEIWPDSPEQ